MPNKLYRKLIHDRIQAFLRESETADLLTHLGMRGGIRESALGKLIADLLPVDWGIGSGKVIDSSDSQSAESDLIIFYKRVLPPIFFSASENTGVFPLESCGFVFEVKTKSTATEIRTTIKKFNTLKNMQAIRPKTDGVQEYVIRPIRVYFALDSDLKEDTSELERYIQYDDEHKSNPAIEIICVVGKGVWFYHQNETHHGEPNDYWVFLRNEGNHEELIFFFAQIINQIISLVTDRSLDMKEYITDTFHPTRSIEIIRM